jgi:tetratricopeptide (TPR) repeat protein
MIFYFLDILMNGLRARWNWLSKSKNQKTLAFIGSGLIILAGGAWQAYEHWSDNKNTSKASQTITVSGGVGAGRDVNVHGPIIQNSPNSNVKQYYGVSEERFQTLSEEYGVTKSAITSFFKILEQKQVPLTDLDSKLRDIAQRYKDLQAQLATLSSDDAMVIALKQQAKVALDDGDFDKTEKLLNEASDKDVMAAKALHATANKRLLSAASSKAEVGDVKHIQLAYMEAATYYQKAAELVPSEEQAALAGYLNKQGNALLEAGHYTEAQASLERSLAIREKALGPDHPNVAQSLHNLALLYYAQGAYDKAEPLYQRSLAIQEKAFGPDHPDVAASLHNLALLYYAQGAYDKAEPLYQRSLAILEKALGPDHPDVAQILLNYAALLRKLDRADEAEAMEIRAEFIQTTH